MATESAVRIVESTGTGKWASTKNAESFRSPLNNLVADELGLLLKGNKIHGDHTSMVPNRSGSAPPSIEGSYAAFGNLIYPQRFSWDSSLGSSGRALEYVQTGEPLYVDPSDFGYSSSNINLNPRFPLPSMSRESQHQLHHTGTLKNNWSLTSPGGSDDKSIILARSSLSTHPEEPEDDSSTQQASDDWAETSTSVMPEQNILSLSGRHKSLVDLIQEDFPRTPSPVYNQSRSSGHGTTEEPIDNEIQGLALDNLSLDVSKLPESKSASDSGARVEISHKLKDIDDPSATSMPKTSYLDNLEMSPSTQKDDVSKDQYLGDEVLIGHRAVSDERSKQKDKVYEKNILHQPLPFSQQSSQFQFQASQDQVAGQALNNMRNVPGKVPQNHFNFSSEAQPVLQSPGFTPPLYATAAAYMASGNQYYSNLNPAALYAPQYSMAGYTLGSTFIPPFMAGYPSHTSLPVQFDASSAQSFRDQSTGVSTGENNPQVGDLQQYNKFYGHQGLMMHPSFPDPYHVQYFHPSLEDPYGHPAPYSRPSPINMFGGQIDSYASQKDPNLPAYIGDGKFQPSPSGSTSILSPRKIGTPGSNYYGSPTGLSFMPQFPGSPLGSPLLPGSPVGGANASGRRNDLRSSQASVRNTSVYSGWQGQRGTDSFSDPKKHSFLEELKASNARKVELSDIAGRIVEFSVDQHGSRFIQQKLENCSAEEKASVFQEVLPHAPKLMTDVFGNYVIQKFFEHGDSQQRKELASQLSGSLLNLSLQMYGCRVIQKALEVIELDQKTELIHELDGHVMRCVRDQNGNHVIQKCIECVPTEKIGFIISAFQGQVATLSTHPYGCRVIQRVLEHCSDDSQIQCIVDEILESACVLAQDQYGNYVTQHVLERGKQHERSQIISKLTGKVILMSQHKYASNVVEKCLEYGDAAERECLIEEILAQPDENDNLLTMMKDQFANYVVQKILEISNDRQRDILLTRIGIHLHALKKYTYGKHIVARFEQLSGEECGSSEL
ncbi:hypothetical protein ACH5RR_007806 [Cinchona calisaya]|uniref:PUM-HD domain-containing protein n=1 Tax=Cinchona calisaya TaxID=153742 RepID=A0ABD3AB94_9GENT